MNALFEVGELVDVTIKNARVGALDRIGTRDIMRVAIGQREIEFPLGTGVQVTRVAPKEWPPQPGDIWDSTDSSPWGGPWFVRGGNGQPRMVPENMAGPSELPETLLQSVSGLTLVHRRGWTPAAPADHAPEELDQRAETIAGLRELADWLEENPDAPLRHAASATVSYYVMTDGKTAVRDLCDIGAAVGVAPAREHPGSPHLKVIVPLRGGVSYEAVAVSIARELYEDKDVTQGDGEVGASSGVAEAPTSAADSDAG